MGTGIQFGTGTPLEVTRVFTSLGIRFWDLALDAPVTSGLRVRAQFQNTDYEPVEARRSPSGVYAFHGLPGLRDVEYPTADRRSPASLPSLPSLPVGREYVIFVEDLLRRYLPAVFTVALPLPYLGVLNSQPGSLPAGGGKAFLFSAPTRPVPFGVAAVRADLWNATRNQAAAHAVLRVESGADVWTGIADDRGGVLAPFPYPLVERLRLGSPPGLGQGDVKDTTWPVKIRARCQPSKLRFPLSWKAELGRPWTAAPSLKSVLEEQGPALLWEQAGSVPIQVSEISSGIRYRSELVLKTRFPGSNEDPVQLWISESP